MSRALAASAATVNTEGKLRGGASNLIPFKPGQSGNPHGRPKGTRNKLSEAFLQDAHEAWMTHGKTALDKMAVEEPAKFVAMIGSLVPKEFDIGAGPSGRPEDLTDEQLAWIIQSLDQMEAADGAT
jgi:hypothetical protein